MTYVTQSNDIGFYTGPSFRNVLFKTNPIALAGTQYPSYQYPIFVLKSVLKSAGWQVVAWGSGSSTGTYSDPFDNYFKLATDLCWFIVKQPTTSRSLCFQKSGTSNEGSIANFYNRNYRIKYSPTGFSITGTLSPTATPASITFNQELIALGGGTDASPTFAAIIDDNNNSSLSKVFFHVYAQTVQPYGFYWLTHQGWKIRNFMCLDPVVQTDPADQDPYVFWSLAGDTSNNDFRILASEDNTNTMVRSEGRTGFQRFNLSGQVNSNGGTAGVGPSQSLIRCGILGNSVNANIPNNTPANGTARSPKTNRYTGTSEAFPIMYYFTGSNDLGSYKGHSSFIKSSPAAMGPGNFPTGHRSFYSFSFFTRFDAARFGSVFLPWFGTEKIIF